MAFCAWYWRRIHFSVLDLYSFFIFYVLYCLFFFSVLGSMNWLNTPHLLHGYIYIVDISTFLFFFSCPFPPVLLGHMRTATISFSLKVFFSFSFFTAPMSYHHLTRIIFADPYRACRVDSASLVLLNWLETPTLSPCFPGSSLARAVMVISQVLKFQQTCQDNRGWPLRGPPSSIQSTTIRYICAYWQFRRSIERIRAWDGAGFATLGTNIGSGKAFPSAVDREPNLTLRGRLVFGFVSFRLIPFELWYSTKPCHQEPPVTWVTCPPAKGGKKESASKSFIWLALSHLCREIFLSAIRLMFIWIG